LKGSDTLFDIITDSINAARTAGISGSKNLFYDGSGSGNAENQMKFVGNSGANLGTALGVQSIGPMSRNFRPGVIDGASQGFVARVASGTAAQQGASGHVAWAPTCTNVVGLDAAVFLTRLSGAGSGCKNLSFNTFVDNAIPASAVTRAKVNDGTLPTAFGNGAAFNSLTSTVNYSNEMMVVLGGVDGSGTIAACSDPRRIQALQDLAGCMGVDHIEHLFRRDDNSGTTDTWKDRIIVTASSADGRYPFVGGRFCNGQSIGGINGATPQQGICSVTRTKTCFVNEDCGGTEVCQFNLNNQDFDPVRRSCVPPDSTHAPTSCTDYVTGKPCQAGDGNANCTQGLVIALTDTDPGGPTDITTSIAARVKNDSAGQTVGYAGREAAAPGRGTRGLSINTTTPLGDVGAGNVRRESYLLSRRLFLQNGADPTAGLTADDLINDQAGPNISITGGGTTQVNAEQAFYTFAVNHSNVDSIVSNRGFITCAPTSGSDPCGLSNNLCAKTPAAAIAAPLSAYTPNGSFGASGAGGTKSINSTGFVWNGTTAVAAACTGTGLCASGLGCVSLACPATAKLPSNSACTQDADCTSGHCVDGLAIGIPGEPVSLICQ